VRRVEVSTDGGQTWKDAEIRGAVHPKAHTRFGMDWKWDGRECVLQSRCTDELGQVQPGARGIGRVFQGAAGPLQDSRRPRLGQHDSAVAGSGRWERAQCDLVFCFRR